MIPCGRADPSTLEESLGSIQVTYKFHDFHKIFQQITTNGNGLRKIDFQMLVFYSGKQSQYLNKIHCSISGILLSGAWNFQNTVNGQKKILSMWLDTLSATSLDPKNSKL